MIFTRSRRNGSLSDDWESVAEIEISDLVLEGLIFENVKELMQRKSRDNGGGVVSREND